MAIGIAILKYSKTVGIVTEILENLKMTGTADNSLGRMTNLSTWCQITSRTILLNKIKNGP